MRIPFYRWFTVLLGAGLISSVNAQTGAAGNVTGTNSTKSSVTATARTAMTRLITQIRTFPQEKIYLQTDKPYYSAGDRIWFRAHLLHATLHEPYDLSRYIYIELLNSKNVVLVRKKFKPVDKGIFFGQLDLSTDLPEGRYALRAYTHFMRNTDEAFFFRREILVGNILKKKTALVDSSAAKTEASTPVKTEAAPTDLRFFPEGGYLIHGNLQNVGFKAVASNGAGTTVSGRIVDESGVEVTTFRSNRLGMGKCSFKPIYGKTYTAICQDKQGRKQSINLPAVSNEHCALSVRQNPDNLDISLLFPGNATRPDTLFVIGCVRGIPAFQAALPPTSNHFIQPKAPLNTGIVQILLLNSRLEILSERLVFVSTNDWAYLSAKPDKTNYQKREAVHAVFTLKDSKGKPVTGNFSVSVTDDSDVRQDSSQTNIKSYLLLESDLKGNIEQPGSYFRGDNKEAAAQLDALMLTQGWTRYATAATLKGDYSKCDQYEVERGPIVSGNVRTYATRRPIENDSVSLFMRGKGFYIDVTKTDKNGQFTFLCPDFPDSSKIRIDASKRLGQMVELMVYPDSFPKPTLEYASRENAVWDNTMKSLLKKSRDRWVYENGLLSVNLQKVEVVGKRISKSQSIRQETGALYTDPFRSIDEATIAAAGTMLNALISIPGVKLDENGKGVTVRDKRPAYLVDGTEYTEQEVMELSVDDVRLIDVLVDPGQTNLFGAQANIGIIYLYMKRGEKNKTDEHYVLERNQAEVRPLGYSLPAEFYMPKYQVESARQDPMPDLRSTIYWKPDVQTNATGEADLIFYTADGSGTYTVTAEGVTPKGEIIRYQGKINRK
jgi:hypothetical protein